jgi:hypothetical protein
MILKITQASHWLIFLQIQLKIAIFNGKKILLNVDENQPMASLCYF